MSNQESPSHPRNIVLVGFMGSGKSTIARVLHQRLGYPVVEMDQILEKRAGKPITRIFEEDGEEAFRDMEAGLLCELDDPSASKRIISTGGGIVVRPGNREVLPRLGYVVWLKVPAKTILSRTSQTRHRPLLQTENPEAAVREMMEKREPFYEEVSNLALETTGLDSGEIASGILECARYHFAQLS